jgi:dihydrofolate synthase/folylpolyglutamate synthase
MNYQESINYLFTRLPIYQRIGPAAYKANLENTKALDSYFEHPHRHFKSIHIAGTNGKGSVSHMIAAVLQKAGYKTGLYTSPHLKDFRERIRINGEMIPQEKVIQFVNKSKPIMEELNPSFFELTVAMAFQYFADEGVEIAVIETGLGGRLDSTNIVKPLVSVITNIGHDHMRFLGTTIQEIAAEKAGIIKPGRPVVIGQSDKATDPVFEKKADESGSCLLYADRMYHINYSMLTAARTQVFNVFSGKNPVYIELISDLIGGYQKKNLITVLQTLDSIRAEGIKISRDAIYEGIRQVKKLTGLRGRWEEIAYNPLTVCDTAHNPEGIAEVMQQIQKNPFKTLHIVWGMVSDKDPKTILSLLPKNAKYYFTKANIPRALDENELLRKAAMEGLKGSAFHCVSEALTAAKKEALKEDFIFIGGSTFVVAEAL